ncbi:molybdopterin molybdotransferase MoeA [Salinicoccus sp. ID82-1]|uniref:Molybdopterin molybdenumtransferase n=1 Tax=Salinicoccus cyprini TaxID=2493691 RepID=A0A558AR55_9STAP|nr:MULTISPECIES: gephyrin-like molybdotransferase Glp [Salinicoccus]MCG1010219.1 molybdopterin molybdotransferase MoeA [Salinicoccus sp. ID82-1]TVT26728.1 molybdopterin molybdotransferase MoeA [Salinicoccus cyprini]
MNLNRTPIAVTEAVERVVSGIAPLPVETVSYTESYGRILAQDLEASMDVPRFDKSAMDGFAIRAEDSAGASGENRISFKVAAEVPAGATSDYELKENEAFRIMTGAPVPKSADAVVMFEQTRQNGGSFSIRKPFEPGENIALQGEECRSGDIIVPAGTFINPGTVAALATFGYKDVQVHRQPVVGILATGSELVDIEAPLEIGKIRNSNGPMVESQLQRMNIEARRYALEADDFETLLQRVREMLDEVDAIITTGGVSVGDYDHLPKLYEALGAKELFNKVGMRPGSVTTVSMLGDIPMFGLSGNPSACYTGFELFARPAFLKMMGHDRIFAPVLDAVLDGDFKKANPFTRFVRAEIDYIEGRVHAKPAGFNKSNAVTSIAKSNGIIVLPGGTRGFGKGDGVKVMMTDMTTGIDHFDI